MNRRIPLLFLTVADESTAEGVRSYFAKWAERNGQVSHGGAGELAFLNAPIDPVKTLPSCGSYSTTPRSPSRGTHRRHLCYNPPTQIGSGGGVIYRPAGPVVQ